MDTNDWWRNIVNGLDIKNDLVGDPTFITEEEEEETVSSAPEELLGQEAAVLRFKLDLYVISPMGTNKAYMVTGKSEMEDTGMMTVKEALKLIERRKKRKS